MCQCVHCPMFFLVLLLLVIWDRKVTGKLLFEPLDELNIFCGDGSPAGIYQEESFARDADDDDDANKGAGINVSSPVLTENHIIVFLGGGVCTGYRDCLEKLEKEPYKLSSKYFPTEIEGHTILSRDAEKNPVASDFTRWLVPYCSQDLFLGSSSAVAANDSDSENNSFTGTVIMRNGDAVFEGALEYWKSRVTARSNVSAVDKLLVAGISAGAIGLVNHFESVVNVARDTGANSLRIILDSVAVSDQTQDDSGQLMDMQNVVNFQKHPLCNQSFTQDTIFPPEVSSLPCCASIHCMLLADPFLRNWSRSDGNEERLLLLDSIYDPLAMLTNVTRIPSNPTLTDITRFSSDIGETAGGRRQQFLQSTYLSLPPLSERVIWVATSSMTHSFLLPELRLEQLRCDFGGYYGGDTRVCREDGVGIRGEIAMGLWGTFWVTTETWILNAVQGKSIRDVIRGFVYNEPVIAFSGLVRDYCHGVNCVDESSTEPNPAQQLFELEDNFVPINSVGRIALLIFFILLMCTYAFRFKPTSFESIHISACVSSDDPNLENDSEQEKDGDEESTANERHEFMTRLEGNGNMKSAGIETEKTTHYDSDSERGIMQKGDKVVKAGTIHVENVCVEVEKNGITLLKNISLKIPPGTINGLMGLSGSGKTTLLNLLGGQLPGGLKAFSGDGEYDLDHIKTTYLRQLDFVSMQNMSPRVYLCTTASIYGASKEQLEGTLEFVRPFFLTRNLNDCKDDPFCDTKIKNLSGGQKRMVAITAALLMKPALLLLDEPLSGLDSVSSNNVLCLLKKVVSDESCSILMTVHQPSDEILKQFDQNLVLSQGEIVMKTSSKGILDESDKTGKSSSDFIHELLLHHKEKGRKKKNSITSNLFGSSSRPSVSNLFGSSSRPSVSNSFGSSSRPSVRSSICSPSGMIVLTDLKSSRLSSLDERRIISPNRFHLNLSLLRQIHPIVRRMHIEYGADLSVLVKLPICFIILCFWLQFDDNSPLQVLFVSVLFCTAPVSLLRYKVHETCIIIRAHKLDLEDGRISFLAFQIGTLVFTSGISLLSLIIALSIGYAVLGWDYNTFIDQFLFCGIYLLVTFQLGRVLSNYYSGDYRRVGSKYSLYVFLSFLFSGALVSPNKIPDYISWLIYLAFTFWAVAGTALTQFHFNDQIGETPCLSFTSCLAYDGPFLSRFFGYTPIANTRLCLIVMGVSFCVFFVMEFLILTYRYSKKNLIIT